MYSKNAIPLMKWDPIAHLQTIDRCGYCESQQLEKLQKCGRCQLVYYCNRQCQRNDYAQHKGFCLEHKKIHKSMKTHEAVLRDQGYFTSDNIGHFWGLHDPRDYCRAKHALSECIVSLGHNQNSKRLYEIGLSHLMELLRLCHGDNMGVRDEVCFILLKLNRDQDAYNFIKWWQTIDPDGVYDWGDPPPSNEGDWLYLKNQNILEDLLQITELNQWINLNFLSVLFMIKMRIVYKFTVFAAQFKQVQSSLQSVLKVNERNIITNTIGLYLTGGHRNYVNQTIKTQTEHADKYLSIMVDRNKIFVQSLLNPQPLRQFSQPTGYSHGSTEEAWLVHHRSWRAMARIRGAKEMITEKVGENPQYTPKAMFDAFY
eukprot:75653_1